MRLTRIDFEYVKSFMHEATGVVIDDDKDYFVENRLDKLATREGLKGTHEVLQHLRLDAPRVRERVIDALMVNETSFFRDHHTFESLRLNLLPALIQQRSVTRRLRIWSAASSTGQEAYSLAMLIREYFPETLGWDVRILASDISNELVERAREGRYSQIEISRGIPAAFLIKYFDRQGLEWTVREELRQLVEVRQINLIKDWFLHDSFDLILMRNVLMYFCNEAKRRIYQNLNHVLHADGYLLLGSAETPISLGPNLNYIRLDHCAAYSPTPRTREWLNGSPRIPRGPFLELTNNPDISRELTQRGLP